MTTADTHPPGFTPAPVPGAAPASPPAQPWGTAVAVTAAGLISTALVYAWILHLQAQGRSPGALGNPDANMRNIAKYWAFPVLQATGLTGLVFAYLSTILGLRQSSRPSRWFPLHHRQIDRLHRHISLLVIGLVLVHIAATVLDAMGNTWQTVVIPGHIASQDWPEAVWGFNSGIYATYLLLLVAPTFYLRRGIGIRRWRFLHRFVVVFYILSVWHTLILGLDVAYYGWMRPLIWLAQIPLLALLIQRLRRPIRSPGRLSRPTAIALTATRHTLLATSYAAIAAAVAIVATGHSDFIHTV